MKPKGWWLIRFEYQGRMLTLSELAAETGIPRQTLAKRLQILGWSVQRAATTPVRPHTRHP